MKKNKHDKIVQVWHNRPFMSLYDYKNTKVYSLNRFDFVSNGVEYIITATESTGSNIYDVRHMVKNTETGNKNWVEMKSLINMFESGKISNSIKEKAILCL